MVSGELALDKKKIEEGMKKGGNSAQEAFAICSELSKQGNREAMGYLARMYRDGIGTTCDVDLAIVWMKKAYEKKLPYARLELSIMLSQRSKDDGCLAFELCKSEVAKKNPKSYSQMSYLYTNGIGCAPDLDKAIQYMEEAYQNGIEWAGLELVKMLVKRKGRGDASKAFEICSKLSASGNVKASGLLGQMYRDGVGCSPNKSMAIEKLKIAAPKYEWAHKDLVELLSK